MFLLNDNFVLVIFIVCVCVIAFKIIRVYEAFHYHICLYIFVIFIWSATKYNQGMSERLSVVLKVLTILKAVLLLIKRNFFSIKIADLIIDLMLIFVKLKLWLRYF